MIIIVKERCGVGPWKVSSKCPRSKLTTHLHNSSSQSFQESPHVSPPRFYYLHWQWPSENRPLRDPWTSHMPPALSSGIRPSRSVPRHSSTSSWSLQGPHRCRKLDRVSPGHDLVPCTNQNQDPVIENYLTKQAYFGSGVCNTRKCVAIADKSDAALEVSQDLLLHFPAICREEQVNGLIAKFEVFVP